MNDTPSWLGTYAYSASIIEHWNDDVSTSPMKRKFFAQADALIAAGVRVRQ